MRAGQRRNFIRIEIPVKVKSSTGAIITVWELYRQVWASVEFLKGYEKQSSAASWPGADYKIGFNFVAGVLPTMRISFEDKIYSILKIDDIEYRHRNHELICQSGVKAA